MDQKTKSRGFLVKLIRLRIWVQTAFLIVWLDPMGLRMHQICGPVFHCYACPLATFACPIGIIAQFGAVHLIPFIAIGLLVAAGAIFGGIVCGWACPFGLLQDLGAKVPIPKVRIPKWAGYFRYVILIGTVLIVPYFFGEGHPLFVCRICPAGAIEKALPDMITQMIKGEQIVWPNAIKLTILITFVIAIFFSIRPWCRVLCPLGAIFGFFNRFSFFTMRIDEHKCNDCNRCRTLCSYGGTPDLDPNQSGCIRCLECTKCGPKALEVGTLLGGGNIENPD